MTAISTKSVLTAPRDSSFFLAPESHLQRQYEALRAFFGEQLPSVEVGRRFGYTPGSFRVLCHQFRHDPDFRARFFSRIPQEPALAPVRDPLRDLVVAMRKRNLSVYDIQRELAGAGHTVSINTLTLLLRQEGFARLPRRLDEERPQALRPEPAAVADVRTLSLAPRSFRTRAGGLFLFLPVMRDIRLGAVVRQVRLPGSAMIPAMASSLYRLLAARIGREYGKAQAKTIFSNLLEVSATVQINEDEVIVSLDKRAHNPYLVASQLTDQPVPMPWFGNRRLLIRFA
jgi:hypothetical protein